MYSKFWVTVGLLEAKENIGDSTVERDGSNKWSEKSSQHQTGNVNGGSCGTECPIDGTRSSVFGRSVLTNAHQGQGGKDARNDHNEANESISPDALLPLLCLIRNWRRNGSEAKLKSRF